MAFQSFPNDFIAGLVAEALTKGASGLHHLQYVFPNRRAGLFFARELKQTASREPGFGVFMMPITQSLDEFACSISPLRQLDQTAQLFRLYQSYKTLQNQTQQQVKQEVLSFDKFLFWGQMLLADYEQATQAMARPEHLFGLLLDQHRLDENFSLDAHEAEIIAKFLPRFKVQLAEQSGEGFLSFWNLMLPLFRHFSQALINDKLAFPGLILSDALARIPSHDFDANRQIIFAGFSQLSKVQAGIIESLLAKYPDSASVRWDSHPFFVFDHQNNFQAAAALKNARQKPLLNQSLDRHLNQSAIELEKTGTQPAEIFAVGCPLQISQVKHAAWLISQIASNTQIGLDRIAVIMPNPDLLFPLINSLPKFDRSDYAVNITIGYPMRATPVYSLVGLLLDLQKGCSPDPARPSRFRYSRQSLLPVLRHTYIMRSAPETIPLLLKSIITDNSVWVESNQITGQITQETGHNSSTALLLNLIFERKKQTGPELSVWLYKILIMIYQFTQSGPQDEKRDILDISANNAPISDDLYPDNIDYSFENIEVDTGFNQQETDIEDILSKEEKTDLLLEQEYLYHAGLQISRLQTTAQQHPISDDLQLWADLIMRFLQNVNIPFSGDPIRGIQVMGLLESQNLDFDYVILLDSGENQMPPAQIKPSFIPQQIRKAFGLAQIQDTEAQYAYLISRLLYRSKKIYFLYDSAGSSTEKSRFLLQFEHVMGLQIHHSTLQNYALGLQNLDIKINKNSKLVVDTLTQYGPAGNLFLSPSSLANYISCSLKFYYSNILKLKKPIEQSKNQDNLMIGNITHKILEEAIEYASDSGSKNLDAAKLQNFLPSIKQLSQTLIKQHLKGFWQEEELEGQQFLNNQIIIELATGFLERQILESAQNQAIQVCTLEKELEAKLNLNSASADLAGGFVRIKGKPDRVDKLASGFRICDYKTSTISTTWKPKELKDLFDDAKDKKQAFQLMCYAWLLNKKQTSEIDIQAALVWLAEVQSGDSAESIADTLCINKQTNLALNTYLPEFEILLAQVLEQLFDSRVPFVQTKKLSTCQYCDFKDICRR